MLGKRLENSTDDFSEAGPFVQGIFPKQLLFDTTWIVLLPDMTLKVLVLIFTRNGNTYISTCIHIKRALLFWTTVLVDTLKRRDSLALVFIEGVGNYTTICELNVR